MIIRNTNHKFQTNLNYRNSKSKTRFLINISVWVTGYRDAYDGILSEYLKKMCMEIKNKKE